mgnify:CR=1 FL=1
MSINLVSFVTLFMVTLTNISTIYIAAETYKRIVSLLSTEQRKQSIFGISRGIPIGIVGFIFLGAYILGAI